MSDGAGQAPVPRQSQMSFFAETCTELSLAGDADVRAGGG